MLAVARARLGDRAHLDLGNATSLPYAGGTFDLVSCKLALHEMPPETRSASARGGQARVLKTDGRILLIDFHPGPFTPGRGWITGRSWWPWNSLPAGSTTRTSANSSPRADFRCWRGRAGLRVESQMLMGGGAFAVQCLAAA